MERVRERTLGRSFSLASGILSTLALGVGLWGYSISIPLSRIRLGPDVVVLLGVTFLIVSAASVFLPARVSLSLLTFLSSWVVLAVVEARRSERGDRVLTARGVQIETGQNSRVDAFVLPDPILAIRGAPNRRIKIQQRQFEFEFTLDEDGRRVIPPPRNSIHAPEIWFLGCSVTFGWGVNDDEAFVSRLAGSAWTNYKVRNLSLAGAGTTYAHRVLQEELKKRRPSVVFYGWIDDQARRNYRRKSFWQDLSNVAFIHFELEGGRPTFVGIEPPERCNLPDGPELDQYEVDLSYALLKDMDRLCSEHGATLIVLAYQSGHGAIRNVIDDVNLRAIDLSSTSPMDVIPFEGHPTRYWHQDVARLLSSDSSIPRWTRRADLYQPAAIPSPPIRWDFLGSEASRFHPGPGPGTWFKVDGNGPQGGRNPFAFGVRGHYFQVRKGERITFSGMGRSGAPQCEVQMTISNSKPYPDTQSQHQRIEFSPSWLDIEYSLACPFDADSADFTFFLGRSNSWVELKDIRITVGDRNVMENHFFTNNRPMSDATK